MIHKIYNNKKRRTGGEVLFESVAGHVAELLESDGVDIAVRRQVTFLRLNHRAN